MFGAGLIIHSLPIMVPVESPHRSNGVVARPLLWLTAIALLALALRLYQIGAESLWVDEWLSLRGAKHMDQLTATDHYFTFSCEDGLGLAVAT